MTPQVTEEQLKSLKLFSIYLQSYGAETATKTYSIEYCDVDYEDDHFHSPQTSIPIETYDKINEVLNEIIKTNDLFENATTDCDLRGELLIYFNTKSRLFKAIANQWQISTNEYDYSKSLDEIAEEYDEDTYNEFVKLFEKIGEGGRGEIRFQGSGDDGFIEDEIDINGSLESVPKLIEDMIYQWLMSTHIDWYNNEGGQGSFFFFPNSNEILLEIGQNYEEEVNVPLNFEVKF